MDVVSKRERPQTARLRTALEASPRSPLLTMRPASAQWLRRSVTTRESAEAEGPDEWDELLRATPVQRLMTLSKTELGSKFPGSSTLSRPHTARRTDRSLSPELTQSVKKLFKPHISLNGYALYKAAQLSSADVRQPAQPGYFSDRDLFFIRKARTLDAFFRALGDKPPQRPAASRYAKPWKYQSARSRDAEAEQNEEQQARLLMNSLHKRFVASGDSESVKSETFVEETPPRPSSRVQVWPQRCGTPALPLAEEVKKAPSLEVVGIAKCARPQSALSKSTKSEPKPSPQQPAAMRSLSGTLPSTFHEPRWRLIRAKTINFEVVLGSHRQGGKVLRNRIVKVKNGLK